MKRVFIIVFALLSTSIVRADEGMWLLSLLGKNIEQMQAQGCKLTAEDIYSVNQASLKDAIVGLGNAGRPFWHFCSGEIISDKGLVLTNHHCGFGVIQQHSTVEHDYLSNGFWAYKYSEELPNPGITASILQRMEDVTDQVNAVLNDKRLCNVCIAFFVAVSYCDTITSVWERHFILPATRHMRF